MAASCYGRAVSGRFDRRSILKLGAAQLATAGALGSVAPRSGRAQVPGGTEPPDGPLLRLSARPPNYESVRATFRERVTPIDHFFVRSHHDTPSVSRASWRLSIGGMVGSPLELGLTELEALPAVEVEAVLQCAGNGRALFRPRIPGVQWRIGAMGNARWSGVRLADLLARARPKAGAAWVVLRGADRPVLRKTPSFFRAIPLEKARHPDTLIGLGMNGAALPLDHGGPARVVVPGWAGDDWVKWISRIELTELPPEGFFFDTAYRVPVDAVEPGASVPPERMVPLTELAPRSLIAGLAPASGGRPAQHDEGAEPAWTVGATPHVLSGVAFSGGGAAISAVEVTTDGGSTWVKAELEVAGSPYGFQVFRHAWTPPGPGRFTVAARATDTRGRGQPEVAAWNPSGYLHNAIEHLVVEVKA